MRVSRRAMIYCGSAVIASAAGKLSPVIGESQDTSAKARQLFAWAIPIEAPGADVDHTWVTTYDNRITAYDDAQAVSAANEAYWYAWGDFHRLGGTPKNPTGFLGAQLCNFATAECTAAQNADCRDVPAARGTIFVFGVDGVCHQLSNQILFSTGSPETPPLTVVSARGYWASSFLYGAYGLNQTAWNQKEVQCADRDTSKLASDSTTSPPRSPDDFEARARAVLPGQDQKLKSLLALRSEMQELMSQSRAASSQLTAESLNARNQERLDEAAKLLGPEAFKQIFGYSPEQRIYLVDPSMIAPTKSK